MSSTPVPAHLTAILPIIDDGMALFEQEPEWFDGATGNMAFFPDDPNQTSPNYAFGLGPAIDDYLSDRLTCDEWIKTTFRAWLATHNLTLDVGSSENTHTLMGRNDIKDLIPDMLNMIRTQLPTGVQLIVHEAL